jgi:hypothetical protein
MSFETLLRNNPDLQGKANAALRRRTGQDPDVMIAVCDQAIHNWTVRMLHENDKLSVEGEVWVSPADAIADFAAARAYWIGVKGK